MKTAKQMLIFDIDGVITNLQKETLTEPTILDYIIKILEKGEPVALNTGRGIDWTQTIILNFLKNKAKNINILGNLFVVAENGGIKASFNQDGYLDIEINNSMKMPQDIDQDVRELIEKKYFKNMRRENKETMITAKIKEGTLIKDYAKLQKKLVNDLQTIINTHALSNNVKIQLTTIGTDIIHRIAGKDRGIELILKWLLRKGITPQKFITFGDNKSDIPMAEKLFEEKRSVELIYVGKDDIDTAKYRFPVIITKNKFEKGTLEFLKTL
jgi:hydroxymethylpyrimidine pyrophosphatase-like HAD family hydrolase